MDGVTKLEDIILLGSFICCGNLTTEQDNGGTFEKSHRHNL